MQRTPVFGLPYVEAADSVADYPAVSQELAQDLDAAFWTTWKKKSADQDVVNSAVLVNDTELVVPIAAGDFWLVEWLLFYCGDAPAGDFKLFINAGGNFLRGHYSIDGSDTAADAVSAGIERRFASNAGASAVEVFGVSTLADIRTIYIRMMFNVLAGAFPLGCAFAQSAAVAATRARMKAGSVVRGKKLN